MQTSHSGATLRYDLNSRPDPHFGHFARKPRLIDVFRLLVSFKFFPESSIKDQLSMLLIKKPELSPIFPFLLWSVGYSLWQGRSMLLS